VLLVAAYFLSGNLSIATEEGGTTTDAQPQAVPPAPAGASDE